MRCTDGIKISEFEYSRIVEELSAQDQRRVRQVLHQDKEQPWDDISTYLACLFLDVSTRRCLIYPVRPLVCRLFGLVPHLPCPAGKISAARDASNIIEAYYDQTLMTFQEWMMQCGHFSFDTLLGEEIGRDYIEL